MITFDKFQLLGIFNLIQFCCRMIIKTEIIKCPNCPGIFKNCLKNYFDDFLKQNKDVTLNILAILYFLAKYFSRFNQRE